MKSASEYVRLKDTPCKNLLLVTVNLSMFIKYSSVYPTFIHLATTNHVEDNSTPIIHHQLIM